MSSPRTAFAALVFVIIASLVLVLDVAFAATRAHDPTVRTGCALTLTTSGEVCK